MRLPGCPERRARVQGLSVLQCDMLPSVILPSQLRVPQHLVGGLELLEALLGNLLGTLILPAPARSGRHLRRPCTWTANSQR